MTSLANEVAALKTKVATLESKQNNYATKSELERAISGLKALLEGLIEQLRRSLESAIDAINRLLRDLLGRNSENLEGRVRNLETRVGGLENVFDSLRRTLESLIGRVGRLESQIGGILSRLQAVENGLGQALMDIRNLYSITSRHENAINDLWGQIRNIWAAIALLQGQIAGILTAIANLLKLFRTLPPSRNGRDGSKGDKGGKGDKGDKGDKGGEGDKGGKGDKGSNGKDGATGTTGRNGTNGTNGANGANGRSGANGKDGATGTTGRNGTNGTNGANGAIGRNGANGTNGANGAIGRNGANGKDGKDLIMQFSNISIKVFQSCNSSNQPVFGTQNIQVIKGTEAQITKEFNELANIRGAACKVANENTEGEIFDSIDVSTIDKKFVIPSNAQKIIIEFREIKPYISKRFSNIHPKYKNGIGTISFFIDAAQSPDIFLQYQRMVIPIPKGYTNKSRSGYIYLEDCKALISFWKAK